MELKIFNISRHVPQSTIRILFSILGDILFFDYYSSVSRRDGTFECVIVYRELSEAQLAAKLDGSEMGDRCLEVRLSESVDRFDIGFSGEVGEKDQLSSRTLLVKSEDLSCDLNRISNDFSGVFRSIELERDLGAGLPPLSARFFLLEFASLEGAAEALKIENSNYSAVAEAHKHMQSFTVGNKGSASNNSNSASTSNMEEVLIYGVPASKLLDPTTTRFYTKLEDKDNKGTRSSVSNRSRSISRSRSPPKKYNDRDYDRDRNYRHERDRERSYRTRRSRSRSAERRRR